MGLLFFRFFVEGKEGNSMCIFFKDSLNKKCIQRIAGENLCSQV
jgi:hypothetical protein